MLHRMTRDVTLGAPRLSAALVERLALLVQRPDPVVDAELWDSARLEEHGRLLASASGEGDGRRLNLRRHLKINAAELQSAYAAIVDALQDGRAITPAAQWIVDNFHVISDQLGDVPLRLTVKVWRELPAAGHADAPGWPRIYHIATEYLRHRLWEFQPESLLRLLAGYQSVAPLKMQEIWILYPMLRIALIDELRNIAERVEDSLASRAAADELADLLAIEARRDAEAAADTLLGSAARFAPAFIVQLAHRLQGMGEHGRPLLDVLTRELSRSGITIDDYIQRQHARRSATNVAARNIITSLRELSSFDWRSLFEKSSVVEALLLGQSDYVACDRRTRDRYRSSIEGIAQATGRHEVEITRQILELLQQLDAAGPGNTLGSWLIGPRRLQLEAALHIPVPAGQRLRRWTIRHASALYFSGIFTLTLAVLALTIALGTNWRASSHGLLVLLGVLAAFPASELVIGILNRQWLRAFPPRHLPRLALESGLRPDMKTLVVVPTLLRTPEDAVAACRQLHVHALANNDAQIRFALLSDWTDSPTETRPGDALVLDAARNEIAALNRAEPTKAGEEPRFYLLHRRRVWSPSEQCYTGWERKRGKLQELNHLLLNHGETTFLPDSDGVLHAPRDIRYVLTVDADTRLPLGSVRDLAGTAAHPLNLPVMSATGSRVVEGYGVLQPRITPLLPGSEERSLYRQIITSASGIDPYAAAVSDLYQDVFGEGLFTGKGLYDVGVWEKSLQGRIPAESLLSHDLFEGLFVRCGLVSDLELFEDFPSHSEVAAARGHRWMRGDWQLLPWILGLRGRLPPLGRWKMIDNLRRSLVPPCSLALLVAAFADRASHPWIWLALVLSPAVWPALATAFGLMLRIPAARSRRMHLYRLAADLGNDLMRAAVSLAMLAQSTWLSIDAIARALFRLVISRRRLLEWTTAAQLKAGRSDALASFVWPLKSASIVVVSAVAVLMAANPPAITQFAPFLLLWWLSPILAQFLSRPLDAPRHDELPVDVDRDLRATARLTWTFFEQFVTAEDNFLPPDNFQEDPAPVVAHRSSPTNMGLYLLSTVAARDFGWLGLEDMTARLTATFATLQRLEKFEGHLLNWYDTRSLLPLEPRYVSTVDSGNLAGHLLTLRQACIEMRVGPLLSARAISGPADALTNALRELMQAPEPEDGLGTPRHVLYEALRSMHRRMLTGASSLGHAIHLLRSIQADILALAGQSAGSLPAGVTRWLHLAARDLGSQLRDLEDLLPEEELRLDSPLSRLASVEDIARYWDAEPGDAHPAARRCRDLCQALDHVAAQCLQMVSGMSFAFLFDRSRGLFSIGYRVTDRALDPGYYDLLASEARLASLVAIAKGDVPRSHWFRLGRRLTGGQRRPALASWSGSMFEYLMPALVMHEPRYSLLEQTNRRVVWQHMRYGERHHLPWGISESAYNVRDREYTYQYSGFGVPSLGLKRGLASDYVVAPYATALAAMVRPIEANENFHALNADAARGEYGFYEALDFTDSRIPEGKTVAVVRAYMAHHQGMSIVALDNVLQDFRMQSRFHADPRIAAADLLLQERGLRFVEAPALVEANVPAAHESDEPQDMARTVEGVDAPTPVTHLLSNRNYTVMLTDSGAGYSSCRGRAVTRWREDVTRDCWGSFIYLCDPDQRQLWSAGFQPTAAAADEYHAWFNEESAVYARRDGTLRTTTTVVVTPEDDGELRRVALRNDGTRPRHIELTSYAEIVLAPQRADVAHPAFSNLFVQTEFIAHSGALLATRRPRSDRESAVWAVHVLAGGGTNPQDLQYETDRSRFIGRGHDNRTPQALEGGRALSGTVGKVLDPVFSLRARVTIPPRGTVTVIFGTFVAATREQACALATKYRTAALFEHVRESAWTFARSELYYLRSSLSEARLFQSLASHLLLGTRQLRAAPDTSGSEMPDVTHLWRFSISGDRPILLIRCHSQDDLPFVQQCLRAQEYLRVKHVAIDVVILNERRHSYIQDLQHAIERLARAFTSPAVEGEERGGIHPLAIDTMSEGERRLLLSLARVVLNPAQGGLLELLSRPNVTRSAGPATPGQVVPLALPSPNRAAQAPSQLEFFNGLGGFDPESGEYVIALPRSSSTPAPWSNVLANEQFGTLVTERGSMCTWSLNSRENQLTAWSNDAVCDPSPECFYLLDEDGMLWSPSPQPIQRPDARYLISHGQGYTRFSTSFRDFETRLTVFVVNDDPVKVCHVQITNHDVVSRRLRVVSYVEWSLGASRSASNHCVQTRIDAATGAQFAGNPPLIDFGTRVAFCDLGGRQQFCTDSRQEFLGRNGRAAAPAGISAPQLWTLTGGPGCDPCCAFATTIDVAPGETAELSFVLGQASDAAQARELVLKYRQASPDVLLQQVQARWSRLLGAVRISTPDRALDLLFNNWLLYQTISCRLWGRAAFYQCGGAYGFRDQLQDIMALTLAGPEYARAHILRAAARQYVEGDAQHWWHPPSGRGVRTHISDDRIWLPFVVHHYMQTTQDASILEETVPFIEGPPLPLHQEDSHYTPEVSATAGSLYEHCARALDCSLATGVHALPLIGGGDWNDGMNRVGHEGRGESVWLAWFLIVTLRRFLPVATARQDKARAARWAAQLDRLVTACERAGWDGRWYRRAFFDDGTPLGSQQNSECRIDSIAQSWGVLSGAAQPGRAAAAMNAVEQQLIRDAEGIVLLFTPPFDGAAPQDPGYIKGYLPGLRENGGQYTHAAIWVLMAEAMLGREVQVARLLKMLNPVHRSATADSAARYRVEPYVLAADIYSGASISQRGGWTWYTGAAGWMYRAVLESVLGIHISGNTLRLLPCMPDGWTEFEVELVLPGVDYVIRVARTAGAAGLSVDGVAVTGDSITLLRDDRPHRVELHLSEARSLDEGTVALDAESLR